MLDFYHPPPLRSPQASLLLLLQCMLLHANVDMPTPAVLIIRSALSFDGGLFNAKVFQAPAPSF